MSHVPSAAELVGSWELLGLEPADADGRPLTSGALAAAAALQPDTGELTAFPDGRIFVLMSRRDRAARPPAPGTPDGFFAMRGHYTYEDGLLTYTPDVCSNVQREKLPFRRWATVDGDRLVLRTEQEQGGTYWLVHWRRI
jgi:hypothetical protein